MEASVPNRLIDIAKAIEASIDGRPEVAGLDRSGRAATVGPNEVVQGVRVERTADGELAARIELVGLAGTRLSLIGDELCATIGKALQAMGHRATVTVAVTDLVDEKPDPESQ